MVDEYLTYRSSGVDVGVNNETNERIKKHVRRTRTARVVTEPGLFSGGVALADHRHLERPVLYGALGFAGPDPAGGGPAAVLKRCRAGLPAPAEGVAFLDYVAAARLEAAGVEERVRGFADALTGGALTGGAPAGGSEGRVPLVGGETAEMPGVFRPGRWEMVGALYGVAVGRADGRAGGREAGAVVPAGGPADGRPEPRAAADLSDLRRYRDPVLMVSMDGVGTKVKLGVALRRTRGFAFDILHHSVDDILCQGARGVGVLVYLGCHSRDDELSGPFREGVEDCAREEGLAVLEFAVHEDPETYLPGEIDICASIAGLVDRAGMITGSTIAAGDRLIGLGSDGLHTNGYSLARRALLDRAGLSLRQELPELGTSLGEALLAPHRGYARPVLPLLAEGGPLAGAVRGIAHITGGGLRDNIARILPPGLGVEIHRSSWPVPPLFDLIRRGGNVPEQDPRGGGMYETFNMGVGLVLVVAAEAAAEVRRELEMRGERVWNIGQVTREPAGAAGSERVRLLP